MKELEIGSLQKKIYFCHLKSDPNQAYTLNYLAYTWIEKDKNTNSTIDVRKSK